jgi:uncharacterized damage-inducible protein DinB
MTVGVTLEELLAWNDQAAVFWKHHLDTNPALLELPCDIGGAANVREFVRHIWLVELRWGQRLAGLHVLDTDQAPYRPLDVLFELHRQAMGIFRNLLAAPATTWEQPYTLEMDWVPPAERSVSRRKVAAHTLFHSQRHWAQLATLLRQAGFPSRFRGDFLFARI